MTNFVGLIGLFVKQLTDIQARNKRVNNCKHGKFCLSLSLSKPYLSLGTYTYLSEGQSTFKRDSALALKESLEGKKVVYSVNTHYFNLVL